MMTMTQDEITRVLDRAREGTTLVIAYDSPRGERRFGIKVVSVKHDENDDVVRVRLERGTAAWMFVQRAKLPNGESCWCFFQPNPYPIYEVAIQS
jgi:hypothetical protein